MTDFKTLARCQALETEIRVSKTLRCILPHREDWEIIVGREVVTNKSRKRGRPRGNVLLRLLKLEYAKGSIYI